MVNDIEDIPENFLQSLPVVAEYECPLVEDELLRSVLTLRQGPYNQCYVWGYDRDIEATFYCRSFDNMAEADKDFQENRDLLAQGGKAGNALEAELKNAQENLHFIF